ncbi:MAG: ParB N-terminal domain-containing protein [Neisseriaceae bacterium]|nr:ParB N-terminal domain-containing protein [Neisseriaceae bacterium]
MSNKQLEKLIKDIRVQGVKTPLTVTEYEGKFYILDGHHRALAAPRAGVSEVPINRVEIPWGPYKTPTDLNFTPGGY